MLKKATPHVTRVRALDQLHRGDEIEARLSVGPSYDDVVIRRGSVQETAPGIGVVWILDRITRPPQSHQYGRMQRLARRLTMLTHDGGTPVARHRAQSARTARSRGGIPSAAGHRLDDQHLLAWGHFGIQALQAPHLVAVHVDIHEAAQRTGFVPEPPGQHGEVRR